MTRDIACTFIARDGRRVEVALDVKGNCNGPTPMTPEQHYRRGARFAHEFMIQTALRRKFGTPRNAARALGLDERLIEDISTSTEYEPMPYPHRRAGDTSRIRSLGADRRRLRAQDEGEDPIDYVAALMSEMSPEELGELKERIGSDRRRRATDEPPPFPGRPVPGHGPIEEEDDPLKRWRQPGEDRKHAADRRRYAHDQMNNSHATQDANIDFERRFPSAAKIRFM